jgi:acetyl-CoA synthetase
MVQTVIHKSSSSRALPNLGEYEEARSTFSWEEAARGFGLPAGTGLNMAYEAVTRHAQGSRRTRTALRWRGRRGQRADITYVELEARSNRFANVLRHLGIGRGDVIALVLPRIPELYIATLGALKNGSVITALFPAFGPEPIRQRLELGGARVVVTTDQLHRRKLSGIRGSLPQLEHVIVTGDDDGKRAPSTVKLGPLLGDADEGFDVVATDPEDLALLHFTSGTTGTPKGAMHVHSAVVAHHMTGRLALDLHPDDVFWCTADPGWVTGMSYGVLAPLTNGVTSLVDEADFDAERWYQTLQDEQVSVWYTSPTALRMLMRSGTELPTQHDLSALRFIASVGEPLNPEVVEWTDEVLGLPAHDNWWQTETGGIMIANYQSMDIKPGSMGRPLPGIDVAILARDSDRDGAPLVRDGRAVEIDDTEGEGHLAIRRGWPSMFRGYLNDDERYQRSFIGDWYVSGDLARRDHDGYLWFVGRADDVIKSSGHLIGPFEVESALIEHPAVVEAGVIGKPDPVAGEVVKAFVTLAEGWEPSEQTRLELVGFARSKLGAAVAPREIEFDQDLPHTRSGKIMRRLLKARELGLPEGDLSTLETGA